MQKKNASGLSRIEVLVVLGILVLGFLLVVIPAIHRALEPPNTSRVLSNGSRIYKSVFAEIADVQSSLDGKSRLKFPMKNLVEDPSLIFDNSTDYFKFLVTNGTMNVNWSFFTASHVRAAPGRYDAADPASIEIFRPKNNAWSVVADLNLDQAGAPFLITRNLQEDRLKTARETRKAPALSGAPYGEDGLVVIRIGGAADILRKRTVTWANLNPGGLQNEILHPAPKN